MKKTCPRSRFLPCSFTRTGLPTQRGELSAAIELRRLFPGITDNVQARACARTIAGWKPLPTKKQLRQARVYGRVAGR